VSLIYLPSEYVLEERGCLHPIIDIERKLFLYFDRHKPEIGAKTFKETNTIRPLHKVLGLTKGISLHRVQNGRESSDKVPG
jgi:hypothetical protein